MQPRISIITLGVADLARSYRFYAEGLGLPTTRDPADGIVFFQTQGVTLALFPLDELAADIGTSAGAQRPGSGGITLAHNVRTRDEVDEVLAAASGAGADILKRADDTEWGGYSGYFADPDGHVWEVAWGAFPFNDDGSLAVG